jgi:UDP-glucuronate 4-epimerase
MTVLVTGAAGFIGSTLVDALLARGDEVIGLDNFDPYYDPAIKRRNLDAARKNPRFRLMEGDILDSSFLGDIIRNWNPEGVVHLAAAVSNRQSLHSDTDGHYFRVNVRGTDCLINACTGASVRSFVYVSTGNVYDHRSSVPFQEEATPVHPRTPYSRSKREAEIRVLEAAGNGGPPVTVLRFFTVFGPRQRPDMVHHRFCTAMTAGEPLKIIGEGSDLRDYLYVADGCAAITASLNRAPASQIINIGSGRGITLNSLLELLSRLTRKPLIIERRKADPGDTSRLLADVSKAKRLLGWEPSVDLETGLAIFVDWLKQTEKTNQKELCPS